jgi:surface polysaccharide O-acyltransferase-like enzyme
MQTMDKISTPTRKRVVYIDVLRVIAILCVISQHATSSFTYGLTPYADLVTQFFGIASYFSVTLFFLISGAVILGERHDWGNFYKKHLPKLVLPLILIPLIATALHSSIVHLWFLREIIVFYILSPIISAGLTKISRKQTLSAIVLLWVYAIVVGNHFLYLTYFLTGYFLHSSKKTVFGSWTLAALLLSLVGNVATIFFNLDNVIIVELLNIVQILMPIFLFIFIRCVHFHSFSKFWSDIGKCVFGIYLIHLMIMDVVSPIVWTVFPHISNFAINALCKHLAVTILTFVVSYLIVKVFKKIPIVNKII